MHKDRIIEQMQQELLSVEEQKKREVDDKRKKDIDDIIQKANQPRLPYQAVKGDPVDEMMAKFINECDFYVPVERLTEGNYMFAQKKVFAKIMNGKLIIRVGGGYMLIEEFLRHFQTELQEGGSMTASLIGQDPLEVSGRGTPPRSKFSNHFISYRINCKCKPWQSKQKQISKESLILASISGDQLRLLSLFDNYT